MKRLLLVLPFVFLFPLIIEAQYTHTFTHPIEDMVYHLEAGVSAWQSLPNSAQCKLASASVSTEGNFWCVFTSDNLVHKWDATAKTWSTQTAMASAVVRLAVQDDSNIYSLQLGGCASHQGITYYRVYHWSGSAWSQPNTSICTSSLTVGHDGYLAGIRWNSTLTRQLSYSSDSGVSWHPWADNWSFVNMWQSGIGCAVDLSNTVWEVSQGNSPGNLGSPATGIVGCAIFPLDNEYTVVWTSGGAVYSNYDDTTWSQISGLVISQLVGASRGSIFALDSAGHPYHLNMYAGALTESTTGTYKNVPGMNVQIQPHHTGTTKVKFPHSINGIQNSQTILYSSNMNVGSWDANPLCDPFIGANDPECAPIDTGGESCSQVGPIGSVPSPPSRNISNWYVIRDWTYDPWQDPYVYTAADQKYHITVHLIVMDDCQFGTTATCHSAIVYGTARWDLRITVSGKTLPAVQAAALVAEESGGPFHILSAYLQLPPPLDPSVSCVKLEVRFAAYSGLCD